MAYQAINVGVTAVATTIGLKNTARYTLRNDGTANIYYRCGSDTADFIGSESQLQAASDGYLRPGDSVIIGADEEVVVVVCAAGTTATLAVAGGEVVSATAPARSLVTDIVTLTADDTWQQISDTQLLVCDVELTALVGNSGEMRIRAVGDTSDGGLLPIGATIESRGWTMDLSAHEIKGTAGDKLMYDGGAV